MLKGMSERSGVRFLLLGGLLLAVTLAASACHVSLSAAVPPPSPTPRQVESPPTQQQQTRFPLPSASISAIMPRYGTVTEHRAVRPPHAFGYACRSYRLVSTFGVIGTYRRSREESTL